jgi:hypothetical protein
VVLENCRNRIARERRGNGIIVRMVHHVSDGTQSEWCRHGNTGALVVAVTGSFLLVSQ